MTYPESLKSGHIAVFRQKNSDLKVNPNADYSIYDKGNYHGNMVTLIVNSDIYAVNAINRMIDSARDL